MPIPSDPVAYDFFGNKLAIDEDGSTIVILNRNYNKGGVYIYEMPAYLEVDGSVALMTAGQNPKFWSALQGERTDLSVRGAAPFKIPIWALG